MALIKCENVTLGYENTIVLENLDLTVNAKDYLCIVGENGSGKSTLIKALLGLKPALKGKITMGDGLLQNEIGYLPQQTSAQKDFPASVKEVVMSGCLNRKKLFPFYNTKDHERAMENMHLLGIENLKKKSYQELSGGQQQRVLLARALCATSKLLLLDEPVAGLDPLVSKELYEVVKMLNKQRGITIIMVSHDVGTAIDEATHILHLRNRVLFSGAKAEYLQTSLAQSYLGGMSYD
ncbi:MAG: metal ABC transporter ATP-binding protein [Peptostreptococcaceae bacterium]|nr:metal ABC transporter ATP-binding protein [Peptostreptococcaceae bacterium]